VLAAIPGRARDMLSMPDGTRRFPYYGHGEIMRVAAILQHQVAQIAPDRVELRLVVRRPLTAQEEERILMAARAALGAPLQVVIGYRDAIPRLANGKFAEFTNETTAWPSSDAARPGRRGRPDRAGRRSRVPEWWS